MSLKDLSTVDTQRKQGSGKISKKQLTSLSRDNNNGASAGHSRNYG